MARKPDKAQIRSYQVGFGDCFLLSFVYDDGRRHVLIDFGTTGLPRKKSAKEHMPKIAQRIRDEVGAEGLTAVIATHRHADHISGFATDSRTGGSGAIIKALKPKLVLQPWTEDPRAAPKASSATGKIRNGNLSFVATLATMNDVAEQARQLAAAKPEWMTAASIKELSFLGEDNIANKSAVENLMAMGAGKKSKYLRYGDKSGLEKLLPGVKVHVLGPPDLTQSDAIRVQKSRDQDEFWQLVKGVVPTRLAAGTRARAKKPPVPAESRWFRDRLQGMTERGILEIVRQLDAQMNNTSLILLFEFNGHKLLFPGDAQLENWSHALQGAANSAANRALLADVDFYKVGHHGSLNATPRQSLWLNFKKRKGKALRTMMSTLGGKHGRPQNDTEVPRETLVAALKGGSELKTTQTLKVSEMEHLTEIPGS
jgi:hypothetical protein